MTNNWSVIYYVSPTGENFVFDFLLSCDHKHRAKLVRILTNIEEYGLQSVVPHLRKIEGYPLWEICVLGKDNSRIIYVVPLRNTILLLHGFAKKCQKTPTRELEVSLKRYKEWSNRC